MYPDNLSIPSEKRIIDLTYGELVQGLRDDVLAAFKHPEPVVPTDNGLHPETGLPEGPEDEVGNDRAKEILRSPLDPISTTTILKYRSAPVLDPVTGQNTGGYGLPYRLRSKKCIYKVKDLLAIRDNLHHFLPDYLKY